MLGSTTLAPASRQPSGIVSKLQPPERGLRPVVEHASFVHSILPQDATNSNNLGLIVGLGITLPVLFFLLIGLYFLLKVTITS